MTLKRYSIGVALLAAAACSQSPDRSVAGSAPEASYVATGPYSAYAAPSYAAPVTYRASPQAVYAPAVPYAPTVSYAPAPLAAQPLRATSAPILERYAPTVAAARPAAPTRPRVVPARYTQTVNPRDLPGSVEVGGRSFRAIDEVKVAELASRLRDAPIVSDADVSGIRGPGIQVTTSEPFSIPTGTGGKPYYLGSTPPAIEYRIPSVPQEEPLWCWAAAAQQAIGWVNNGRAPAQCAIVALAHGLNVQECCADRKGICARTGEIPAIAKLVRKFGGEARELATVPRDPKEIYDMLRNGDTLLIRIRPAPHDEAVGIRHMIVVRGIEWLRLPNNQLQATLLYNDPLGAGERAVNFDEIEGFFEQAMVLSRRG